MGVTDLWSVLQPTARPTRLETLNRKRLAIDASIWIYQFLKAVRDREGNALRNSHVVGFFRRICKLLYYGTKPVFVFDGAAPALKRETIRKRVRRREGRKEDAARTAGKLLALQVERAAEEERDRRRKERERPIEEELPDEQELVYVDEIGMGQAEREKARGAAFKKKDQYHLPNLDVDLAQMGGENDPRVMSQAELEEYAKQFHDGEDINLYDFSKIDFDSTFFQSLPPGDRYNILNAARLRSRLRMGYSKEQLDGMFPDRMAFSRFQIERVKERNELTQRLMHVNGMNEGDWNAGGRIAGERGREYILVKNEGVEGGWALGVVSDKRGRKKENAIDLDKDSETDSMEDEDDEEFEDVPIEGLNRLPSGWKRKRKDLRDVDYDVSYEEVAERIAKRRRAVYEGRRKDAERAAQAPTTPTISKPQLARIETNGEADALFVGDDNSESDEDVQFEDVNIPIAEPTDDAEEDDLQRAITLSLQDPDADGGFVVEDGGPDNTQNDNDFDLTAALAESRKTNRKPQTDVRQRPGKSTSRSNNGFSGPLPFESLNLGQSLLGKKKAKKAEEAVSGGFERADEEAKKKVLPVPDWFNAAPTTRDMKEDRMSEDEEEGSDDHVTFGREDIDRRSRIRRTHTKEVIDLDNDAAEPAVVPNLYEGEEDADTQAREEQEKREEDARQKVLEAEEVANTRRKAEEAEREQRYEIARQIAADDEEAVPSMGVVAEELQANPPPPTSKPNFVPEAAKPEDKRKLASTLFGGDDDDDDDGENDHEFEDVDWSDSDHEGKQASALAKSDGARNISSPSAKPIEEAEDDEFEDVIPSSPQKPPPVPLARDPTIDQSMFIDDESASDHDEHDATKDEAHPAIKDEFDPDSDEELLWQLAAEADEHERFTASLNRHNNPNRPEDTSLARQQYEAELKSLRSQQKRDRRDADEVTSTMIAECQSLLRYFGLPYITAPAEAEAQCAALVSLGLVDGIVTDDSDIFLFGGTRVYKNMFNAAKYVECYLASDLEKEYALDRKKLIRFAHLLGSDYTEGVAGVGPVTALEIITDFSTLPEFRTWAEAVQRSVAQPSVLEGQLTTPFRRKFKNTVLKKLFLPAGFPDARVDAAYLEPEVDDNTEEFQWGVPDLPGLRAYLMSTIGWSQERMDEILVPVIRDMNKRDEEGVQSNITKFYAGGVGVGAAAKGRGLGGANGEVVEGSAPRNRTGKESGRMKNAYIRLRQEAERKRRRDAGLEVAEEETMEMDSDHGEPVAGETSLNGATNGQDTESAASTPHAKGSDKRRTKPKSSTKAKTTGKKASMRKKSVRAQADNDDEDEDEQ